MKDVFPGSLGQKHGCALYTAKYGIVIRQGPVFGIEVWFS